LTACLTVAAVYLLIVVALVLVRLEVHRWGIILSNHQLRALSAAAILHAAGAVVLGGLLFSLRYRKSGHVPELWSKAALAGLPFLVLVSLDRICAAAYPPLHNTTPLFVAHPQRMWAHQPFFEGPFKGAHIRINSHGHRGPEVAVEKSPGERRIFLLGDSIVFGWGVAAEECLVSLLPLLAARGSDAPPLSVINSGVVGYSPWQEYDVLRSEARKWNPDVVIQVFCLNDVVEKFDLARFGGLSRGYASNLPSRLGWSGLYRMARANLATLSPADVAARKRREKTYAVRRMLNEPEAPEIQEAWRITLENMAKIQTLARREGLPLAIVCFPYAEQLTPNGIYPTGPQERLAEFAAHHNTPFLDLSPVFQRYYDENGQDRAVLFIDGLHLSPEGHRLAAEAIHAFLVRQGWLE